MLDGRAVAWTARTHRCELRGGDLKIIATSLATHFRNNPSLANQRARALNTRSRAADTGPLISAHAEDACMHLEIRDKLFELFTFRGLAWLGATPALR